MDLRPRLLGLATDQALQLLQGGIVEMHPDYLVQRMPSNPSYHWGNCLILDRTPDRGSLGSWLEAFHTEHPGAAHVAIAVDDPDAELDPAEADAHGLTIEQDVVLTARDLTRSTNGLPSGIECARFDLDDDAAWSASVELDLAEHLADHPAEHLAATADPADLAATADPADLAAAGHRAFLQARHDGLRLLQRQGHGAWFGAHAADGRLVATLGVYLAGPGLARYQNVLTARAYRRRGIAGTLLRYAGAWAQEELGATTLVIVADPVGPAIGAYRAAGFRDHQRQWALYRAD